MWFSGESENPGDFEDWSKRNVEKVLSKALGPAFVGQDFVSIWKEGRWRNPKMQPWCCHLYDRTENCERSEARTDQAFPQRFHMFPQTAAQTSSETAAV